MKRVIGLTIAFMLLLGMTGIGTFAYFSDVESSTNNQLAAGTLDLKTNDADGVSQTLYADNIQPGDTVGPETIVLKNTGSVAGTSLDLSFSYVESDGSPNPINMDADETAAKIEVTTLSYAGSSLLSSVSDNNANSYKDVEDLKNADLSGQSGINASSSANFTIALKLREETGNNHQADGISITMTFLLNQ
jgi:predicted ribosomally synthesized peptide with SipW-like signal peptide